MCSITAPGRNYVTLKITTDDGLVGWGDATLNGRELAVASYLCDHVCPQLIGRDAHQIEDTWQYLYKGAYWRRGPVTMTAIAAVDVALWDIKGKAAGLPVYQLLGGAARNGVMVYGHASGASVDEMLDDFAGYLDRGYRAVRAQCAVPGMDKVYGVHPGSGLYEPASAHLPAEESWETGPYLRFAPQMLGAVRERFGFDVHLLHDVHHRLTPIEAGRLGKDLEEHRLFWMEDATPAEDQEAFRLIRQHTTTPLAVGEVFNTIWDCQHLITERLIDYIRTSVSHAGGISHLRKIFSLAELYGVRTGSHGAGDLSPVSLRRRAARRHGGAELRHPGVHGSCRAGRRGVPHQLDVPQRPDASRRRARTRASTSTRRPPNASRTTRNPFRSTAGPTDRCTTGEHASTSSCLASR